MMVLIYLDIPPEYAVRAKFVFRVLSERWGFRTEVTMDPARRAKAQFIYSGRVANLRYDRQVVVPFDPELYRPETACRAVTLDGRLIWVKASAGYDSADLIASTFRLLTMVDERQIQARERDALGGFITAALPHDRRSTIAVPLVDHHAVILYHWLLNILPSLRPEIAPRWPRGKTFAVCLSHDTDAVHIGHARELATAAAKWLLRRKRVYRDLLLAGWRSRMSPMSNPYWGFPGWHQYENECGVRSCFYLSAPPKKSARRLNDCKSDVFAPGIDWSLLRAMHAEGWEFGLHPAIHARDDLDELLNEKRMVEERMQGRISGLRHHYLAFDNHVPSRTFKKYVDAGFAYDSSVGWRDKPGFRAGTCLPWELFDTETDNALNLLEVPLCLMDGHVMNGGVDQAINAGADIISTVQKNGGVLTLNWHTETYCSLFLYKGFREALQQIMRPLLERSDVWFATPRDVADWWRKRSASLQAGTDREKP